MLSFIQICDAIIAQQTRVGKRQRQRSDAESRL